MFQAVFGQSINYIVASNARKKKGIKIRNQRQLNDELWRYIMARNISDEIYQEIVRIKGISYKEHKKLLRDHRIKCIKTLIDKGADVNYIISTSPLIYSSRCSQSISVMLIEAGANINYKDKRGNTALHYSTETQYHRLTKCLVKNGADIDCQNNKGMTALHHAARRNDIYLVKYLLFHGANINITNKYGLSPVKLALLYDHEEIAQLLSIQPIIIPLVTMCLKVVRVNNINKQFLPPALFIYPPLNDKN